MKKKILLLTLATTIVLTACGGNAKDESADVDTMVAEDSANVTVEDVVATEEPEIEEPEVVEPVDDYVKGIITETGWESQWLDLRYTAPEGMEMASEAELNKLMGLGEQLDSEDYEQLQREYANLYLVQEMRSVDGNGTSVFVTVEKSSSSSLTAEKYIDALSKSLALASAIQYEIPESPETVDIAGKDFLKLAVSADFNGKKSYQDYYVRVRNKRILHIIVTYNEDTVELAEHIVNGFTAY